MLCQRSFFVDNTTFVSNMENKWSSRWFTVPLRLRLQTLPSSYTSTSQMPLFLRGSLVRHRHRGRSRRRDGRSIPRTSQALAQEHGRVEVTVPQRGSALARATDRPPVAALSHAQSCVGPACSLNVSRPTDTKEKNRQRIQKKQQQGHVKNSDKERNRKR